MAKSNKSIHAKDRLKGSENDRQIIRQKNNVSTLISICNYVEYQSDSKADDKANGQQIVKQTDTNKNVKKEKKEIKSISKANPEVFLDFFNNMALKFKGKKKKFSSLTPTDISNLNKLKAKNYSVAEYEHAYRAMILNPWVIENNMDTPSHYLRNDNFQKYVNVDLTLKVKAAWE